MLVGKGDQYWLLAVTAPLLDVSDLAAQRVKRVVWSGAARACTASVGLMHTRSNLARLGNEWPGTQSSPVALAYGRSDHFGLLHGPWPSPAWRQSSVWLLFDLTNTSGFGSADGKEPPSSFWPNRSHKCFSLFALFCCCIAGRLKFPPVSSAVFRHRHQMPFQAPLLLDKNASQPLLFEVCHSPNGPDNPFSVLVSFLLLKMRSVPFFVPCLNVLSLPPAYWKAAVKPF